MASLSQPPVKKMRSSNPLFTEVRTFKFMIEKSISGRFALVDPEGRVEFQERFCKVAEMPWRVRLIAGSQTRYQCINSYMNASDVKLKLDLSVNWDNKSTLWHCHSHVEVCAWFGSKQLATIINVMTLYDMNINKIIKKEFETRFDASNTRADPVILIEWADLIDPKNCYLPSTSQNDQKYIEMEFFIELKVNVLSISGYSFPLSTNSTLVLKSNNGLEPKSIPALSAYSQFFRVFFFGNFNESISTSGQFDISEEDHENFEIMVKIIDLESSCDASINVDNVSGLLALADKYIVPSLQKRCLEFLMGLGDKHIALKLRLADSYSLAELENRCLIQLANGHMLEQLRSDFDGYKSLSDRTKIAILDSAILYPAHIRRKNSDEDNLNVFIVGDQDGLL